MRMTLFENLRIKMKHSHFLRLVFDAVSKLGIRISPLFIFKETADPHQYSRFLREDLKDYETGFWGPEEIKIMALIPGRQFKENELINRLREGQRCFGLKKNGKLVAFSWCNLREFSFLFDQWPLNDDEAYLHDVYTDVNYRGKGIAPHLRYHLCRELEKIGRTKIYSLSDYFNTPAVNFKLKLNAKKIKLNLYVGFFGKWHLCFTVKDYQTD